MWHFFFETTIKNTQATYTKSITYSLVLLCYFTIMADQTWNFSTDTLPAAIPRKTDAKTTPYIFLLFLILKNIKIN